MNPSEDLKARAYRHPETGDLAWLRQDALLVTKQLASRGQAILGGEAWMLLGMMRYLLQSGPPEGYYTCDVSRRPNEDWAGFTGRSQREADAAILDDKPLIDADVPAVGRVYYNLTWASEEEYAALETQGAS